MTAPLSPLPPKICRSCIFHVLAEVSDKRGYGEDELTALDNDTQLLRIHTSNLGRELEWSRGIGHWTWSHRTTGELFRDQAGNLRFAARFPWHARDERLRFGEWESKTTFSAPDGHPPYVGFIGASLLDQ